MCSTPHIWTGKYDYTPTHRGLGWSHYGSSILQAAKLRGRQTLLSSDRYTEEREGISSPVATFTRSFYSQACTSTRDFPHRDTTEKKSQLQETSTPDPSCPRGCNLHTAKTYSLRHSSTSRSRACTRPRRQAKRQGLHSRRRKPWLLS